MKSPSILVAAEGRTVYSEDGALWPAEGMEDPQTLFTRRRLADGDLVAAKPAAKPEAKADDAAPDATQEGKRK